MKEKCKFLVASRIEDNGEVVYDDYQIIAATDPGEAIYKYNTEHHTCHGKCICRMFDDQPVGSITEDAIFDYLGNVVKKLHAFVEHYTKTL